MPLTRIKSTAIGDNTITDDKITGGGIAPTGTILPYSSEMAPTGWLLCDGSAIDRSTYSDLFSLFDTDGLVYGAGDGSTTFNLPDLQNRVPVGQGGGKTVGTQGGSENNTPSGSLSGGGVDDTTLSTSNMPSHNHGGGVHGHSGVTVSRGGRGAGTSRTVAIGDDSNWGTYTPAVYDSGTIISPQGSGSAHGHTYHNPSFSGNSMSVEQPYTVINYIIKY